MSVSTPLSDLATAPKAPTIPSASLTRLALYFRAVQQLEQQGAVVTTSQELAERTGVQPFHVRKDLAYCGRFGRQGQGYAVGLLRRELMVTLGLHRRWHYIIVGLDLLGQSLLHQDWGNSFVCVGLFDTHPQRQGLHLEAPALPHDPQQFPLPAPLNATPRQLRIRPLNELADFVKEQAVDMAFLTLGSGQTDEAAAFVRQAGIQGILNFGAPLLQTSHLQDSGDEENDTIVEQVDFQVSLQRLAFSLVSVPTP